MRSAAKRSGRRLGKLNARGVILDAARIAFAEAGYDKASIRMIAATVGVDPALVYHYFRDKEQLFASAMAMPFDPNLIAAELINGPVAQLAERIVRRFLVAGGATIGLLRSAVSHEKSAIMIREFFLTALIKKLLNAEGISDVELRAGLAASHMLGLAMSRYILTIPPLATASAVQVVSMVAPNLQGYLTGDLYQARPLGP